MVLNLSNLSSQGIWEFVERYCSNTQVKLEVRPDSDAPHLRAARVNSQPHSNPLMCLDCHSTIMYSPTKTLRHIRSGVENAY